MVIWRWSSGGRLRRFVSVLRDDDGGGGGSLVGGGGNDGALDFDLMRGKRRRRRLRWGHILVSVRWWEGEVDGGCDFGYGGESCGFYV